MRSSRIAILVALLAGVSASAAEQRKEPVISPLTGEAPGAPTGCCCYPKIHPTEKDRYDCKPTVTEFDCKAECSMFKDGRLPSGCKWNPGACQP